MQSHSCVFVCNTTVSMDTDDFWLLLSLTLEQRHAVRPQLQERLARTCTGQWKACLRACSIPSAVKLVLSAALAQAEDQGSRQAMQLDMLLELLERRCTTGCTTPSHRTCIPCLFFHYHARCNSARHHVYSLHMEESDELAEDMLLNSLPVILPDNPADAGHLLTEALSSLKARWGRHSPSEVCGPLPSYHRRVPHM